MDLAILKQVDIRNKLNVKGIGKFNIIKTNEIQTKVMNITDNEIIFDPDAILKLSSHSKLNFQVKDMFEVICFLKFLKKTCGNKLQKCDMKNLLKNKKDKFGEMLNHFENKLESVDTKINKNITNEIHNLFEGERNKTLEFLKKKEEEKIEKEKIQKEKIQKEKLEKEKIKKENENKIKKNKIKNSERISSNENNNIKFLSKIEMIDKSKDEYENMLIEDDEHYEKFLNDPQLSKIISNYYYDIK